MSVQINLVHQQLWTRVEQHEINGIKYLTGHPPQKLHPEDEEDKLEYVIVAPTQSTLSNAEISSYFKHLPTSRIVLALVTDDSTVVYYLIYKGLQPPRKN